MLILILLTKEHYQILLTYLNEDYMNQSQNRNLQQDLTLKENINSETYLLNIEIPSKLNKYKDYIEKTKKEFISIETIEKPSLHLEDSKLGGMPYWPENMEYPILDGAKAKLIAQINFSQLKEQGITLENYPDKGILQFYCPYEDDMAGLLFDADPNEYYSIKIVYHENTDTIPTDSKEIFNISLDNTGMPFQKECQLTFQKKIEYLGLSDDYNTNVFYSFENVLDDDEMEVFYSDPLLSNSGSKIGGYAYFTQQDPRGYRNPHFLPEDDWVLLLQIDSDDNLMWGDMGVANWFIKKEDLLNKNFDKVFFTWDCC